LVDFPLDLVFFLCPTVENIQSPTKGETPSTNWVDSLAIFWGCLENPGVHTYHRLLVGSGDTPAL
jgi:hypothetical protein